MTLGADDYLPKPFSIIELLSAVEARLMKQQVLKQHAEKKLADLRSNISLALPHEFFTPLSGILGFAEILSGDTGSLTPAEITEMGQAIYSSALRLHRHIENFVIYAQIELLAADPAKVQALRENQCASVDAVLSEECSKACQTGRPGRLI